jgi:phosphomevalonate kinase
MTEPSVSYSAPGKIVLIGEYAVLESGKAYVRAVDVRAKIRVEARPEGHLLEAPDVGVSGVNFSVDTQGRICWRGAEQPPDSRPPSLALVETVLSDAFATTPPRPCRIRLDTSEFFGVNKQGVRGKIGLGSSAALTVALYSAARRWAAEGTPRSHDSASELSRLQALHRRHQDGRGSGLDIAASLHGGTFVYKRGEPDPVVAPQPLTPGLEVLCVWSGQSASTDGFLERLFAWRRRNEQAYRRYMSELGQIADGGIQAVASGDVATFLTALRTYARCLESLGSAAMLPIVSPVHRRIERLASKNGLVYKPSGAGGGDIGIALADDPRAAQRFREAVEREAFLVLDCPVAREGLRQEHDPTEKT